METPVSPKVTIAVLAAAIVTIFVWVLAAVWSIDIPVLIQGAITTVIVGAAGWLKHDPIRTAGAAAIAAAPETPVGEIVAVNEASL